MEKSTSVQKNIHNFKKIVKGVLCFCEHMPGKNLKIQLNFWDGKFILMKWEMKHSILWFINQLINT